MTEQEVIEQLSNYKRLVARKQVLENYSVGSGITVSRLNQDDQLQELHRKLRGLPTYMYLSKREQKLETVAGVYLEKYPSGVQSQLTAIPTRGMDEEDTKLLRELKRKIAKVVAARDYDIRDDIDAVLDRVAELQELQDEILKIDTVLKALEQFKPDYAKLLKLRYIQDQTAQEVALAMGIAERTFRTRRARAINEYVKLAV